MLENYKELQYAVADYLGRDDLTDRIKLFIRLCEKRIDRDVRCRLMERTAVADVESGQKGLELPAKRVDGEWDVFMEMRSIAWCDNDGSCSVLEYVTPEELVKRSKKLGVPTHYTIVRDNVLFAPIPESPGKLYLTYYAETPPLSDIQECNTILHTAPDVYLYGSLLESVPFTRGSVPAQEWITAYTEAVQKLMRNEQHARFTANLKMRPTRSI